MNVLAKDGGIRLLFGFSLGMAICGEFGHLVETPRTVQYWSRNFAVSNM